jgi:hypothetical protein
MCSALSYGVQVMQGECIHLIVYYCSHVYCIMILFVGLQCCVMFSQQQQQQLMRMSYHRIPIAIPWSDCIHVVCCSVAFVVFRLAAISTAATYTLRCM